MFQLTRDQQQHLKERLHLLPRSFRRPAFTRTPGSQVISPSNTPASFRLLRMAVARTRSAVGAAQEGESVFRVEAVSYTV